jgi:amidophosphoribosyltransferase
MLDDRGLTWTRLEEPRRHSLCVLELVYFSRPDSIVGDCQVEEARLRMGRELAREQPVDADVVIGLPDSGTSAAIGYSNESGIPYRHGLHRSRYVLRTFIQPEPILRETGVMRKLSPIRSTLQGKRVIAVDDSIIRGTTSRLVVRLLREAGATQIHFRVSSPPVRFPCFMGIDIPSSQELVAAGRTADEVRQCLGPDSLAYLSIDGLMRAVGGTLGDRHCRACFDGSYPAPLPSFAL